MTSVCVDQPYLKSAFDLISSVRCVDLSRHDGHKLCRGHHVVEQPGREKLIEQSCASGALNFLGPLRCPTSRERREVFSQFLTRTKLVSPGGDLPVDLAGRALWRGGGDIF